MGQGQGQTQGGHSGISAESSWEMVVAQTSGRGGGRHDCGAVWREVRWKRALSWGYVMFEMLHDTHVESKVAAGTMGLEFKRDDWLET